MSNPDRIARLNTLLADAPGDSFLMHALALEYVKLGDDYRARSLFEELLAVNPGYVGSYYHLGKLLERIGSVEEACPVYEKGIEKAEAAGDRHAAAELRQALDELT